jgi:hypothetical protein
LHPSEIIVHNSNNVRPVIAVQVSRNYLIRCGPILSNHVPAKARENGSIAPADEPVRVHRQQFVVCEFAMNGLS